MNWNVCKGLWVNKGHEENIQCILQNRLNEGHKMKAAFQGSSKLRWPTTVTFYEVAAEICSLPFEKHPILRRIWLLQPAEGGGAAHHSAPYLL